MYASRVSLSALTSSRLHSKIRRRHSIATSSLGPPGPEGRVPRAASSMWFRCTVTNHWTMGSSWANPPCSSFTRRSLLPVSRVGCSWDGYELPFPRRLAGGKGCPIRGRHQAGLSPAPPSIARQTRWRPGGEPTSGDVDRHSARRTRDRESGERQAAGSPTPVPGRGSAPP